MLLLRMPSLLGWELLLGHVCLVSYRPSRSSHPSKLGILSSSMSFKTWDFRNGWLANKDLLDSLISSSVSRNISRSSNLAGATEWVVCAGCCIDACREDTSLGEGKEGSKRKEGEHL